MARKMGCGERARNWFPCLVMREASRSRIFVES